MYRNVMVPVDGSSFSKEAVSQGLRLAKSCGASLHLVKVAATPSIPAMPGNDDVHTNDIATLYALAADCRANSNVVVKAILEVGPVVDALVGYARRSGIDLIVMRTHARRGFARVWFGSVADALIRESGIPVLVVHPAVDAWKSVNEEASAVLTV
jgi:nucleotide-binding universal stress UspA family protein